jgi:rod shape-determining protein MreC
MRRNEARWQLLYPALLIAALMLFLIPEAQVAALRGRALSLMGPVLEYFAAAHPAVMPATASISIGENDAATSAAASVDNNQETDRLRAEVVRLQSENRLLRNSTPLLETAGDLPAGVGARVISRKILRQDSLLGLKGGEAQGVRLNAGVLYRGAAVGRIVAVGPQASSMALLTHPGMSVGARLADCRIEGSLQGAKAGDGERLCRLQIVGRELSVKRGEHVVTSGLDGAFPPGLWLGDVVDVKKSGDFQWEIGVRPACNENLIENVLVLTGKPLEAPWPKTAEKKK